MFMNTRTWVLSQPYIAYPEGYACTLLEKLLDVISTVYSFNFISDIPSKSYGVNRVGDKVYRIQI